MNRTIDEVRRSEMKLARIVALAADAIICVDENQAITLFNEGAERTFGYGRDEMIGEPLARLIPLRFRDGHRLQFSGFARGKPVSRHMGDRQAVFALRKNGEEFPADASISKTMVGDEAVYTVVLRDVSERFAIEQARRTEIERLKLVMDAGRLGGFELDQQDDVVRLFGHATQILGLQASEIETEALFALMDPQDAQRAADVIGHAARSRHQVEIELRIRRPDSVRRWIRCVAAGSGEAGLWPKLFGTIQDITEQKALQQLLEERVAERTAALEAEIARREQAQGTLMRIQRMEAYGQLTGGIAHDFNNLLTVIGGNLELLDEQITDQRLHRMLARAIGAVEMGSRLTRRLLSFARRSRLEPQVINLNDQVIGVIDLLRRTIGETITISSNLAPELGHVRVDPSEIENAILNLAINARDAMPEGGKVIIETENATLDDGFNKAGSIDAIAPGAYVRLSVTDTGTGMTPEVLARAFEPFFTTKEPGRGTGLGLASIYGFARQSNGTVRIESEPGKGATVSLYLPRIDDQAARGMSASAQESAMREAAAQRRILVVEDNPDVRDITTQRLTRLGYQVASCDSGPAAVAALSSGAPFDLVFSDVVMAGGMSGYDLAAWVMRSRPDLKVLLTSGYAQAAQPLGEMALSWRILSKPYALAELAEAIAEALKEG